MIPRFLLLAAFFAPALSALYSLERPNFVVFIADDVSYDDFACTGDPNVQTPNIDSLAAGGLTFTQAYLTASSCSVSRNSIMTGRYPHNTGAAELHTQPPDSLRAFPELLREAGYYTAHSGKYHMGQFNDRAFDRISRSRREIGNSGSDSWVQVAKERPLNQPFFFWFAALDAHRDWDENAFSGTHDPDSIIVPDYLVDAPDTRTDMAQFYDEVYRFDYRIGEVLDVLDRQGVLQNTLVLVMADNGRAFPHSKTRVNDRGMKTPFIISWPGAIPSPAHCHALVSAIDIGPTLLDLAGVSAPDTFQGRPFSRLLAAPDAHFRNFVFAEQNWHDYEAHQRMVRNRDFMYILNNRPNQPKLGPADSVGSPAHEDLLRLQSAGMLTPIQADLFATPRPREELYDLRSDPEQRINLASHPDFQTVLKAMRAVMKAWQDQTGDTTTTPPPGFITPNWYEPVPHYIRTHQHGVRGEMPGTAKDATAINLPGPF